MNDADNGIVASHPVRLNDLRKRGHHAFELTPEAAALAELARRLDLSELRELSFAGDLARGDGEEWVLDARLVATVVQPCVVTLEPVRTRIDTPVRRRFVPDIPEEEIDGEVEMPEDETLELLRPTIDVGQTMQEALSLALPDYPRKEDVGVGDAIFAEPGVQPLTDEAVKPFAGLADLRDRLKK
ncbi:YceD family protein [Brevirhabdus sp.]|uniref:YceD family protein n=1 Tax=Brevirhabdus sp. TaxID=2004514 RepID=UPI0040598FD2